MPRKRKLKSAWLCYFDGHSAAAGDGWRGMAVVKLGTKWAHLYAPGTETYVRMTLEDWDAMRKRPIDSKGNVQWEERVAPLVPKKIKRKLA